MLQIIALIASVGMPFWNIPLILRIIKRKSSQDISLYWAFGVWACIILMFPASIKSSDIILKSFSISNTIFFTGVVITILIYRKPKK